MEQDFRLWKKTFLSASTIWYILQMLSWSYPRHWVQKITNRLREQVSLFIPVYKGSTWSAHIWITSTGRFINLKAQHQITSAPGGSINPPFNPFRFENGMPDEDAGGAEDFIQQAPSSLHFRSTLKRAQILHPCKHIKKRRWNPNCCCNIWFLAQLQLRAFIKVQRIQNLIQGPLMGFYNAPKTYKHTRCRFILLSAPVRKEYLLHNRTQW